MVKVKVLKVKEWIKQKNDYKKFVSSVFEVANKISRLDRSESANYIFFTPNIKDDNI